MATQKKQAVKLHSTEVAKTATSNKMDYDKMMMTIHDPQNTALLEHCHELTKDITVMDGSSLRAYGHEIGDLMSKTSQNVLQKTHSNAVGDRSAQAIVDLNTQLYTTLKSVNINELRDKTPFQRLIMKIPVIGPKIYLTAENLQAKYNPIADNIAGITQTMQNNGLKALEDNREISTDIAEIEAATVKNHEMVLALKVKEEEERAVLEDMQSHPQDFEVAELKRQEDYVNRIGRRVDSMLQTEANLQLSLIELEGTRQANFALSERADDIVTNVVPNFKLSISVAIHQGEQKIIAQSQNAVIDAANQMARDTAAAFHQNAVEVERLNNRGIYDYETLAKSVEELKKASEEIRQIRAKNLAERDANRAKMLQLFKELEDEIVEG